MPTGRCTISVRKAIMLETVDMIQTLKIVLDGKDEVLWGD
jgi:hypothetical protein